MHILDEQEISVDSSIITENFVFFKVSIKIFLVKGEIILVTTAVALVRLSLMFWHICESGKILLSRSSRCSVALKAILCSTKNVHNLISADFTLSSNNVDSFVKNDSFIVLLVSLIFYLCFFPWLWFFITVSSDVIVTLHFEQQALYSSLSDLNQFLNSGLVTQLFLNFCFRCFPFSSLFSSPRIDLLYFGVVHLAYSSSSSEIWVELFKI